MISSYIIKVIDILFGPLLTLNPLISLILISLSISFVVSFYQRKISSKEKVRELKKRANEIREELVKFQKNKEKFEKLMNEMININAKLLKENLKVIILSFSLGIIFFYWVSFHYSNYYIKLPIPFFDKLNLVYFYIILSIISGIVIGKLLEVR
jgi:uncharacterized membrane protein (DUF106 family)